MITKNKNRVYNTIHLPDYQKSNPYQKLLLANLFELGVGAEYGKRKIYFSNIDVSIIYNLIKNKKIDVLHLHWHHPFMLHDKILIMVFRSLLFVFQLILIKCFKVKIVWTVHNLKNHENKFTKIELYFTRFIALLADAIITHCEASKNEIANLFGINEKKIYIIAHGNYINVYEQKRTRKQARKILQIEDNEFVFLFLGLIRPYKGIVKLIESFKELEDQNLKLFITGRIEDKKLADILVDKASESPNILLKLQYIDDNEIEIYMKSADTLVLPYHDIINSGSAILGMSFGKTIIAPRLGCIAEILKTEGGILYDPEDTNGLIEAMKSVIASKGMIDEMGKANLKLARHWGWNKIAVSTKDVYRRCIRKTIV